MNQLDVSELECISGGTQLSGTYYVSVFGLSENCVSKYLSSMFKPGANDFDAIFYQIDSFCIDNDLADPKISIDERYFIAHYDTIKLQLL